MSALLLPLLAEKRASGWPQHVTGRAALYLPAPDIFGRIYTTDAHFAAYSVPAQPRRLARTDALLALAPRGGVPMVLAVFDLDAPDHQATETWFTEQLLLLETLRSQHPGLFVYRTRGGYRLLWRLEPPHVLRSPEDAQAWKLRYQRWCCYLARAFGLVADPSCADWTRLYRLPHATREPEGPPEQLPTWGDPGELGPWDVQPAAGELGADLALAEQLAPSWPLWRPVALALRDEEVRQGGGLVRNAVFTPSALPEGPWQVFTPLVGGPASPTPAEGPIRPRSGEPHQRRAQAYAEQALARAGQELGATAPGNGRNNLLNAKAYALGRFVGAGLLARGHVEQVLRAAAGQAGLPEFETEATLRSGLERGLALPWVPQWPLTPSIGTSNHPIEPSIDPPSDLSQNHLPLSERRSGARRRLTERRTVQALDPWAFPTTDTGNAERLVARHGRDLHYCHPWQKWLAWDGRRWQTDSTAEVRRRAKETTRSIYAEATTLTGDGPEAEARRKDLGSWARRTEARERRSAMLELAQSEEGIPVLPEQFDADPWLLNCLNGTLDLRTGALRSHQQNDLLTKLCPVAYDAKAICPTWLAFLRVITRGNEELIRFLQRFMGYAMTGVVWEHVLLVCYGTGSNGKSTFLETLVGLLGDYAWQAPPDLLMLKSLDTHPTEMAGLFGVRFAACIETASGRRLDEARMKMLTGGDRVTVRRMREDFWTFRPTHKLALGTNHKPLVATTDHGTWRRQKLVPFTVTIPPEQQDKRLLEKLKAEFSGILRWALEGCLAWQRDGLGEPEIVRLATGAWRDESDALGAFLTSHCELGPQLTTTSKELYEAYVAYCGANSDEPLRKNVFSQRLAEQGFENRKGAKGVRLWKGLSLLTPPKDDPKV